MYMRELSQYAATRIPRLDDDEVDRQLWMLTDNSGCWYQQPLLTATMLREHDAMFPAVAPGRTPDDLRSRASSAFSDSVDAWSERKNQSVARLHGVYSAISHAFYLDGAQLRTKQCLLEHEWVPQQLHIANNSPRDFEMIMARRQEMQWVVNVYPVSTTHFINLDVVRSFVSDVVHPASEFSWLVDEAVSAFSLVHLDYTNNIHRQVDLASPPGFLDKGILTVCCPAFAEGIPVAQDRHRQTEAANMLNVGHYSVSLACDFEFAGLLKVFFEVAHLGAELCEAFNYRGLHRSTHMWFAPFRIHSGRRYSDPYIRLGAEGPELPLRELEAEMFAHITHRSIMQRPNGEVERLTRNQNISWQELRHRETMTDFPALQTLVNTVCKIVQPR